MAFTNTDDFVNWFTNDETKNKPAEISTPEEYNLMATYLESHTSNSGVIRKFIQINNLDFKGEEIKYLGSYDYYTVIAIDDFNYNGNHYTISNAVITFIRAGRSDANYFISLNNNSIIKNLTVNNCNGISGTPTYIFYLNGSAILDSISFSNNYIVSSSNYTFINRNWNTVTKISSNSIIECSGYYIPYQGINRNDGCKYLAFLDAVIFNGSYVHLMNGYGTYTYYRPKIHFTKNAEIYLINQPSGFNGYVAPIITKTKDVDLKIYVTNSSSILNDTNCGNVFYDKDILSEFNVEDGRTTGATKLGLSTSELQSEPIMSSYGWNITRTD